MYRDLNTNLNLKIGQVFVQGTNLSVMLAHKHEKEKKRANLLITYIYNETALPLTMDRFTDPQLQDTRENLTSQNMLQLKLGTLLLTAQTVPINAANSGIS